MTPSNSVNGMSCTARDTATLRQLVSSDSTCGTVELAAPEYDLSGGELEVSKSVMIVGNGAVLDAKAASVLDNRRVLIVASGLDVHLQDLRITGGYKEDDGGGIHTSGVLTMSGCNITRNTAVHGSDARETAHLCLSTAVATHCAWMHLTQGRFASRLPYELM